MEQIHSQIERMERLMEEAAGTTAAWRAIELEYGHLLHQLRQSVYNGGYDMENYMQGKLTEMDSHFKMYVGAKKPTLAPDEHRHFAYRYLHTFKDNALKPYKAA